MSSFTEPSSYDGYHGRGDECDGGGAGRAWVRRSVRVMATKAKGTLCMALREV